MIIIIIAVIFVIGGPKLLLFCPNVLLEDVVIDIVCGSDAARSVFFIWL